MKHIITPDWVKDAVIYQIFPDRFARSERVPKPSNLESWDSPPTRFGFKGGDLLGVAERLDSTKTDKQRTSNIIKDMNSSITEVKESINHLKRRIEQAG